MYEAFYRLTVNPFRLTPDSRFCFPHRTYSRAWAYLQYALKEGEGFVVVTGQPGTGKTTLIEALISDLRQTSFVAAKISSIDLEKMNLLWMVAYAFHLDVEGLDQATLWHHIERFFFIYLI